MKCTPNGIKNMIEEAISIAAEEDEDFDKIEISSLYEKGYLTNDIGLEIKINNQTFILTIQEK